MHMTAYLSGDSDTMTVRSAETEAIKLVVTTDLGVTLSLHIDQDGSVSFASSVGNEMQAKQLGVLYTDAEKANGFQHFQRPQQHSNIRPADQPHLTSVPDLKGPDDDHPNERRARRR